MPLECNCALCENLMLSTSPGRYPPVCHDCWVAYPDGENWFSDFALILKEQLKGDGFIGFESLI